MHSRTCLPGKPDKKALSCHMTVLLSCVLLLSSCRNDSHAQPTLTTPALKAGKVTWDIQPNNNWYQPKAGNEFYILLTLKGGHADEAQARTPLNISVVLDRSGSMDGDKIRYAQKAVNFLVDQLGAPDKLSIVDYDDVVELVSKQQAVKNKELLKSKVNALTPRGSTNLSGGTLAGYEQVSSMKQAGYVNRVLLLTDGLANAGIVEPAQLKQIVQKKFTGLGIGLSTFGIGADYNEDLLTTMAETGRGNYYFISQADQIPGIFAQELKGLLNVVAQNAYVQFTLPQGISCEQVYGYPSTHEEDGTITVHFNDVYANEEKVILVRLRSHTIRKEPFMVSGKLHYTDAGDFNSSNTRFETVFRPSTSTEKILSGENRNVTEMIALYQSADEFDRIIEDADKKDYHAARRKAGSALEDIKEKQRTMPSAKLKAQEVKLEQYMNEMADIEHRSETEVKMIQKEGKAANYGTRKNK